MFLSLIFLVIARKTDGSAQFYSSTFYDRLLVVEGMNAADFIDKNHIWSERPQFLSATHATHTGQCCDSFSFKSKSLFIFPNTSLHKHFLVHFVITPFTGTSSAMETTTHWKPDILIDGYIANTLLPQGTELYLSHFIKCLEQEPAAALVPYASGWIVQRPPAPPTTTAAYPHSLYPALKSKELAAEKTTIQQNRELFDCQVNLDTGTIVPQPTQIKPCKRTGLLSPVFFIMRNGFLGVPYKNLPASKFLYNATAQVPPLLKRPNLNARIRILWPGYKIFHYEFRIFDRKLGKDVPITVSRLVERVARGLHRLYLEGVRNPKTFDDRWKLGEGGVLLEEIKIIGLLHVSQGTWMPMLHLTRHIFPRYNFERVISSGSPINT